MPGRFMSFTTVTFLILTLITYSPFAMHHMSLVAGSLSLQLICLLPYLCWLYAGHLMYCNVDTRSAPSKASNRFPSIH